MVKIAYFSLLLLVLLVMAGEAQCRFLKDDDSSELVSDGMDHGNRQPSPVLLLPKEKDDSLLLLRKEEDDDDTESCYQMYGFLPCATTIGGHLFLIVVYEYFLYLGENYVAWGSILMFDNLGPGVFGATVFNIFSALPVSIFVLVSGLSESKKIAQEEVVMGVGLLAGSTIYFLTLLWGTCVIVGKRELPESSNSKASEPSTPNPSPHKKRFSIFTGYGVTTDQETNYTAMIMVSSLIPFILLQVPADVFKFSYGEGLVVLSALIVSFLLLLVYIIYQIFEPWIQSRRLEYIKHEHLILGILNHVQRHALGNLLTEDGEPNIRVIKRLFEELDQDGSDCLSQSELEDLILKIKFGNKNLDRDDAVSQVMKELDLDGDHKITKEEFIAGFVKWLDEAKHTISCEGFCLNKSYDHLYQAVQPWVERRRQKLEKIEHMMAGLLKYAQGHDQENLITDEGTPNTPCLRRLFVKFDLDGDKRISHAELKKLIVDTKFENINVENDNAVEKVMKELDADGDELITEEEFLNAFTKWIKEVIQATDKRGPHSTKSLDDFLKTWEATDILVDEKRPSKGVSKQSLLVWLQAVSLLVLGIALLSMLSAPLVVSVQNFSDAINIPSFFISFIIIPLATNSRDAVSMIIAASRKRSRTINLTFSEIYGAVFMNNILSLLALLSLVYARGLTWNFSTEVLVVVLVCAIIGLMASFRSTFPLWTSCIAYLLYPLSLVLIYVLIYGLGWS